MPQVERHDYEERLRRISEIFGDIVATVEVSARTRCPYRDRHDHCTALFSCRNQLHEEVESTGCGHDGIFDYRDAWESHPKNERRMLGKLADIRSEADRIRRTEESGS